MSRFRDENGRDPDGKDPYGWYDVSIRKPEEGEEVIFKTAYREYLRGFYED